MPGAGRRRRAVDGRRARDRPGASRSRGGRGGGRGGTGRRSPRWRPRCWSRWPAPPPCSPCRPRPTAGSSRPTSTWRSPTARHEGERRSEVGQRAREAAVRPGDGGDQAVPRRGGRRPGAQGRPVQAATRQAAAGRGSTSTASSKGCSKVSPTRARAARWAMRTSSSAS